jgi:hypothetical protein
MIGLTCPAVTTSVWHLRLGKSDAVRRHSCRVTDNQAHRSKENDSNVAPLLVRASHWGREASIPTGGNPMPFYQSAGVCSPAR